MTHRLLRNAFDHAEGGSEPADLHLETRQDREINQDLGQRKALPIPGYRCPETMMGAPITGGAIKCFNAEVVDLFYSRPLHGAHSHI
jgi:hypothetical protein